MARSTYLEHPEVKVGPFSFVRVEHGHGLYTSVRIKHAGEILTTVSGATGDAVAALLDKARDNTP